jgi:hypothetical protein
MAVIIENQKNVNLTSGILIDTDVLDNKLQLRVIRNGTVVSDESLIPEMTSDISPSPFVATASSIYTSYDYPYRAFDRNLSTQWRSRNYPPQWIKIDIGQQKIVKKYAITSDDALSWNFEASNDETNWITLHTVTNTSPWNSGEKRSFFVENDTLYRYYRLVITNTFVSYPRINEFELYEDINTPIFTKMGIAEYGPIDLGFYFHEIKYITAIKEIPQGTDIKIYTSTSNDQVNYSDWSLIDENGNITSPQGRYIKIKVELIGKFVENKRTIYSFDQADRLNFLENDFVDFDGQLKLKTSYDLTLEPMNIDNGKLYRINIEKNNFKKIQKIYYAVPEKIDLSTGTGGTSGQKVYTATNGVVVTSSAPVYSNTTYYYMRYLFNETITMSHSEFTTYWLTDSSGNQTLTFDFEAISPIFINQIKVWPRCRDDASSNYQILVSDDNINFTEIVPWVTNTHNSSTPYGTVRTHNVNITNRYVRFVLTRNGSWGSCLSEIEFYQAQTKLKYLIDDDGKYKTYDPELGWIIIGTGTLTKDMFDNYGMSVSEFNATNSFGEHIIYELESNNIDVLLWSSNDLFDVLKINAIPNPQVIISSKDIIVDSIDNLFLSCNKSYNSDAKIILSIDKGQSWKSYSFIDGSWKNVNINNLNDVKNNGMEVEELNQLSQIELSLLGNFNQMRFGFYLELDSIDDILNLDLLTMTEKLAISSPKISSLKIIIDELDKKYSGLMFMDESQQYYSTSFGGVLKYLDFGTLISGQTSLDTKVYLTNTFPFDVKNIRIYPEHNIDGLTVEISKSNMPFIAENELFYDQVLGFDEVIEFYVRLTTDKDKVGGGTFDIKVKADAV